MNDRDKSNAAWKVCVVGLSCAVLGGVLLWQEQKDLDGVGKVLIGFGLGWVVSRWKGMRQQRDAEHNPITNRSTNCCSQRRGAVTVPLRGSRLLARRG